MFAVYYSIKALSHYNVLAQDWLRPSAVHSVLLPLMQRPVNVLTSFYNVLLPPSSTTFSRPSSVHVQFSSVRVEFEVCCFAMHGEIRSKSSSNISGGILMKLMKAASSSRRSFTISWSYRPNWGRRGIQGQVQQIRRRRPLLSFLHVGRLYRYMAKRHMDCMRTLRERWEGALWVSTVSPSAFSSRPLTDL